MNKSDVTRGLIDFALSQCLKNMKTDPRRSLRRLNDLALQASKGRFQSELFSLFQQMLDNENSPYYDMLDRILSTTDTAVLKSFGINLGYNAWTRGAAQLRAASPDTSLPLSWLVELAPAASLETVSAQISRERADGRYVFHAALPEDGIGTGTDFFALIRHFGDCDFLLDLEKTDRLPSSGQLKEAARCTNLFFLLPFGSSQCRRLADELLALGLPFAVTFSYGDADADELLSPRHIDELLSWGSPFLSFVPAASCSPQTYSAVDDAILDARMRQLFPALLIHWEKDIDRIGAILSSPAQHSFSNPRKADPAR